MLKSKQKLWVTISLLSVYILCFALVTIRWMNIFNKNIYVINESINSINNNEPIEIVEFNIKDAWESLGEIIGETYKEELIDELFSRFCLGK